MNMEYAFDKWRKRTKSRLVALFSGRCWVCGIESHSEIYDLHHIDPSTKEFSFGNKVGSGHGWLGLLEEAQKCAMVCANCHRLIHSGAIGNEFPYKKYDKRFEDDSNTVMVVHAGLAKTVVLENFDPVTMSLSKFARQVMPARASTCIDCHKEITPGAKRCARCFAKKQERIEWPGTTKLYGMLDEHGGNMEELSRLLHVSSNSIRKRMRNHTV